MSESSDRERLWNLQQKLGELAAVMPLTAPAVLDLAAEIDVLVNRLMGLGASVREQGMEGDPAICAEDRSKNHNRRKGNQCVHW